ncbi:hypothetical protein H4R24_001264 [Coemansia sp. RSA 988]|nr:hypothetical protein H4R24_001264 [Coemansia sp. RSA 988]
MDSAEIELYNQKLGEVELALSADPDNLELRQLKNEIKDLLSLSAHLQTNSPRADKGDNNPPSTVVTPPESATPSVTDSLAPSQQQVWRVGDSCEARYTDGQFYPARVVAVRLDNIYQVTFVGYGDMQDMLAEDMRLPASSTNKGRPIKASQVNLHASSVVADGKIEKAQTKNAKKRSGGKGAQAASSQQAWLKFAKGGSSKKLKAKAINSRSIFKSPDTITGKVGVTNSGKGMTKNPRLTRP